MLKRTDVLDAPLLQLSDHDVWDVRTALTHTLVLGTTGSGKSSGTMAHVIRAILKAGFGALVCVAKPEDAEAFAGYCEQTGRSGSLIVWNGTNGGYNFLAAELARTRNINNVIDLLLATMAMVRDASPVSGSSGEQFFIDSALQMLRGTVPFIYAATGTVRIADILAFVRSAPSSPDQMRDPAWQRSSRFYQLIEVAARRQARGQTPGFDEEAAERGMDYWQEFGRLDAKTAGNIRISVTTALSRFEHGWLRDAFCGETNLCPELMMSGAAVILMNFPVQTHGEDAAIAQKLFKFMAQRVLLARGGMAPHLRSRPVAIIADEAQNFLYHDAEFLAQCRSSRVAVVMATQSIVTLYAQAGGDHPHDRAHHLASNFATIVLHSSACAETNEWFSRKLGKSVQRRATFNENEGSNSSWGTSMGTGDSWNRTAEKRSFFGLRSPFGSRNDGWSGNGSEGGGDNWGRTNGAGSSRGSSWGYSEVVDDIIPAGFFARSLKTGGPANRNRVSAVWWQAGRRFAASGGPALLAEFQQ